MRKWKLIIFCLIFQTLLLAFIACDKDDGQSVNPNITQLTERSYYNLFGGVWTKDGIIGYDFPTIVFDPDYGVYTKDDYNVSNYCTNVRDFFTYTNDIFISFISASRYEPKALLVESYSEILSKGSLSKWDYTTCDLEILRDTSYNISSAHFMPDHSIIYYSYGNELHPEAGYYWMKDEAASDSLILTYSFDLQNNEVVNGFDIHPDGNSLIIPIVELGKGPRIAIYEFITGEIKQLDLAFDFSFSRSNIWLRYNSDGRYLLYCSYSLGIFALFTSDTPRVGVIDMNSLNGHLLDVDAYGSDRSVSIFPNWSPNDTKIVFGSAEQATSGPLSLFALYTLRGFPTSLTQLYTFCITDL